MSPQQLVTVAVRLFAVWLGIYVLREVPSLTFAAQTISPRVLYLLPFFGVVIVVALALWFFPRTVAGKLLPGPVAEPAAPASPDTWLAIGFALIGIWVLTSAIPGLTRHAIVITAFDASYGDSTEKSWLYYYLIELAIGLWLIFGTRGFRRLFWWAQSAGISKSSA